MSKDFTVLVELGILDLPQSHQACLAATEDFVSYVREMTGVAKLPEPAGNALGSKGSWEQIALSVSSPAALVAVCRLWLQRDRKRSLRIKVQSGDLPPMEVTAEGDAISLKALERAIESSLKSTITKE
ncbi:MAG: hypothetical protein JWL97_3420 [Gemmatimonadales bacterium]|jgi:hypothetical protein|nr:hypothetical protein [Gemmatimonadales bacterium]